MGDNILGSIFGTKYRCLAKPFSDDKVVSFVCLCINILQNMLCRHSGVRYGGQNFCVISIAEYGMLMNRTTMACG